MIQILEKSMLICHLPVSYFDFQSGNDTSISHTYNDAVSSISTNTGGNCQFYKSVPFFDGPNTPLMNPKMVSVFQVKY